MLRPIPAYDLIRHWDEISAILAPAVATDTRSFDDVKVGLITGDLFPLTSGRAIIVVRQDQIKDSVDQTATWIIYAAGKSSRTEYREFIEEIAVNAKRSGSNELRIEGKRAPQWARVLGGFELVSNDDHPIYRRAL